ncbi:cipC-like antibiotic response protein [Aspergillus arachidicola]|uniref:CipC-like antibiotic response protein n=1 Tax=Aspergillus arachidicola TaxID=656916 RepID=A0A2G7FFE8_9EURO|nr:cipC-like antibiotic response protein [Aspergillus arachidicola]
MAWGWGESDEAHQKVYGQEKHEGKLSHELIAGAASFEAMKAWEDRQRKEGKPVDRLIETKGLDAIDAHKAKKHAEENAHQMYDEYYGRHGEEYDPNRYSRHEQFERRQ